MSIPIESFAYDLAVYIVTSVLQLFRDDAALAVDLPFLALMIMWFYGSNLLCGGLLIPNENELF